MSLIITFNPKFQNVKYLEQIELQKASLMSVSPTELGLHELETSLNKPVLFVNSDSWLREIFRAAKWISDHNNFYIFFGSWIIYKNNR